MTVVKIESESDWKALFPSLVPYWDEQFIRRLEDAVAAETADNWPDGTDFCHEDDRWTQFMDGVTDRLGWSEQDVEDMNENGKFWCELSNLVERIRGMLNRI
jgi:hypothetical protein